MLNLNSKDIVGLLKKMTKHDEFEIMFNNFTSENSLTISQFHDVLKFMKSLSNSKKLKLDKKITLDIVYSSESFNNSNINYRVTIEGLENINNIINLVNKKNNNEIFSIILSQFCNDKNVSFIRKERKFSDVVDLKNYDIRVRKSSENDINSIKDSKKIMDNLKNLPYSEISKIVFRFKQRISLVLVDNSRETLLLDSTITQMTKNINDIHSSNKKYEVELDYTIKNNEPVNEKIVKEINDKTIQLKKVLLKSNTIISKEERDLVLNKYKNITYGSNNDSIKYLYSMQPISAEVNHIVDNIPNSYSATDKADGAKKNIFIMNGILYLIGNNLEVMKTDITVDKSLDGTILEGEFIFIKESNKYLLMLFDCLFDGKNDLRIESSLKKRLDKMHKILVKINHNKFYDYNEYKGKFNLKKINDHYQKELITFFETINKELSTDKNIIISPKLFIHPFGAEHSEAFSYGHLIWTSCTENEKISCPYMLDGIIYTGLIQKYTNDKREQKFPTYKYKPPENNSIDVYVRFKKNKEKGTFLEIFDNSLPNVIKGTSYRVCELMVGEAVGSREIPTPFLPQFDNHEAYFAVVDGVVRDIEGNIVMNNTVLELAYNAKSNLPHKYRWQILRTRWDKTESVNKYNKRYGNYKTVADKTWKSMKEAVTIEEIKNLSEPSLYLNQRNILIERIDSSNISTKTQDKYYQLQTNLGKNMRQFSNWIKSILIYTYCRGSKVTPNGKFKKKTILDIGSGRGGDIMKFFHARVKSVVGFDPNYENVYSTFDSLTSRYKDVSSRFPHFPKMTFIQGDGTVPLNAKSQKAKILNYSKESEKIIDKVIGKNKFDIINSSFVIHYLFKDESSLKNMLNNIKTHLAPDGYVLLTLFDANQVMKLLDGKTSYTSYYTDNEGKKNKYYEIKKKFDGNPKNKPGNAIDVHMSWISNDENTYLEEYLVNKEFMISSMESIGLKLVETDLFENIYEMNKEYFNTVIQYEENPGNKKFYEKIAEFFKELKGIDKEGKIWNFLSRFYVFQLV